MFIMCITFVLCFLSCSPHSAQPKRTLAAAGDAGTRRGVTQRTSRAVEAAQQISDLHLLGKRHHEVAVDRRERGGRHLAVAGAFF